MAKANYTRVGWLSYLEMTHVNHIRVVLNSAIDIEREDAHQELLLSSSLPDYQVCKKRTQLITNLCNKNQKKKDVKITAMVKHLKSLTRVET